MYYFIIYVCYFYNWFGNTCVTFVMLIKLLLNWFELGERESENLHPLWCCVSVVRLSVASSQVLFERHTEPLHILHSSLAQYVPAMCIMVVGKYIECMFVNLTLKVSVPHLPQTSLPSLEYVWVFPSIGRSRFNMKWHDIWRAHAIGCCDTCLITLFVLTSYLTGLRVFTLIMSF